MVVLKLQIVLILVLLVWETTLIKLKRSFSLKARNNLSIIDRIIEDTRFFVALIDLFPENRVKESPDYMFLRPRFKICPGDS